MIYFGYAYILDTFGYVLIILDTLGYAWIRLDTFGYVWIRFGYVGIRLEPVLDTFLDMYGLRQRCRGGDTFWRRL